MPSVDTLKAFEDLKAAELTDIQAKAILTVVKEAYETGLEKLATKSDLKDLEIKISNLEAKIEQVKFDLLKWFIPLLLGQAALILALLKLLKS
ncbi:MAG: hypothetical protein BZ151_02395 [Desulfobacca sp. 4484_104]|nr:MAG: hypothetical protein BZ151_02395 [Desulfobacca sp. 4484_104]RLA90626.1 MAG: DUF1640 domain-containing protein [Deltaproteobacteria bacterium]